MGESVPPGVSFDSLKLLLDPAQGASRSPRLLASSVVDLSSTLSQTDSVTLSTDLFSEKGRLVAPPRPLQTDHHRYHHQRRPLATHSSPRRQGRLNRVLLWRTCRPSISPPWKRSRRRALWNLASHPTIANRQRPSVGRSGRDATNLPSAALVCALPPRARSSSGGRKWPPARPSEQSHPVRRSDCMLRWGYTC